MKDDKFRQTGTEITKYDFYHPLSITYFSTGLVIRQGDAMIRIERADLPEFSIDIHHAIQGIMRMDEKRADNDEE